MTMRPCRLRCAVATSPATMAMAKIEHIPLWKKRRRVPRINDPESLQDPGIELAESDEMLRQAMAVELSCDQARLPPN